MDQYSTIVCGGSFMQYFISFLEGIVTFISPCLLPMLPIYLSYFAGGHSINSSGQHTASAADRAAEMRDQKANRLHTLKNVLGFILGFTVTFVALGALAGSLGSFLRRYQGLVNLAAGAVVVFFGSYFLGLTSLRIFRGIRAGRLVQSSGSADDRPGLGFFSSLLFGFVFSIGWTPCVGAFLGSALALASQQGSIRVGILMLLCYSAGLGIPFAVSAFLIDYLRNTFTFIKKHYAVINKACGILLMTVGILMMTGLMGKLTGLLSSVS